MAANFRICSHRNSDNLHLKLTGDFDGTSAFELLNTLKRSQNQVRKFFIHTDSLSSIKPFGMNVFQKNCAVKNLSASLTFTGKQGKKLAPAGSRVF